MATKINTSKKKTTSNKNAKSTKNSKTSKVSKNHKTSKAPKNFKTIKPKLQNKTSNRKDQPIQQTTSQVLRSVRTSTNTMMLATEREIAMDFATKAYKEFDTMLKSIVLFGSTVKRDSTEQSDIDIIILIDDVSIKFDEELIAWYRKRLSILLNKNKYQKPLHISSVKLSSWWEDLLRGDPVILNVLRSGEALIDFGGFFNPLRLLLKEGKIKATPEAIYTLLERAPSHLTRAKGAMLAVVDGIYWTMVDSAHAALISANIMPASPEDIARVLDENFVKSKLMDKKYVKYYDIVHSIAKDIVHGNRTTIEGKNLDELFKIADEFLGEMAKLVEDLVKAKR